MLAKSSRIPQENLVSQGNEGLRSEKVAALVRGVENANFICDPGAVGGWRSTHIGPISDDAAVCKNLQPHPDPAIDGRFEAIIFLRGLLI